MIARCRQALKKQRQALVGRLALLLVLIACVAPEADALRHPPARPQGSELSQAQQSILQEIATAARGRESKRANGISVLFACGESKQQTAAAERLAKDLGHDVYRVDLNRVVSKYIGETEKNLRQVFARAEAHHWILFFDEADALFGKRTEVKDSHDRYANPEINYLLQQIEKYDGIAIIAAKRKEHIDTAFTRRLRFVLEFQCRGMS